ncbi:MAG: nucleoside triphosphate pyrophosphohydrolase [Sphingomonadaceae bacterium]
MSRSAQPSPTSALARLAAIMRRLRAPDGCPWDRAQSFATIAPYTVEEAYEVADAIERDDMASLRDELGDLQLQIVYHAVMAEEIGAFTLADVLDSICAKMVRRHPHVFGDTGESPGWEALKAAERARGADGSALAGVARALPALKRAEKLQKRAAGVGFDWPDAAGPRAKIDEELCELDAAETAGEREAELGDLLFSAVNLARHLGIDPEAALCRANRRFEARFRRLEAKADRPLGELDPAALETLWQRAKAEA